MFDGLDVAVHDALRVSGLERVGELDADVDDSRGLSRHPSLIRSRSVSPLSASITMNGVSPSWPMSKIAQMAGMAE